MAEIAILMVALGGLYVISNHDKEEGFTTATDQTTPPVINYPVIKENKQDINTYLNANQTTDKFFNPNVFETIERNNPRDSVGGSTQTNKSLTGEPINKQNFKHNNMVPFFGARVKGSTASADVTQSNLDTMQGAGSQFIRKSEQAPLFKPQANMSWTNGMPNTTEFMLSRQMPSSRMNNVKPWDEEKVAPGLGQGFTTSGSGSGYNASLENRNAWLPKTVDDLRVVNNPKQTFSLSDHQGPANAYVKEIKNTNTMGVVEKNRPDTDYEIGPQRWFTTTGLEKGPTVRSNQIIQHTNRPDYSQTDYYGPGAKEGQATYINSYNNHSHRQQLNSLAMNAPTGKIGSTLNDYGNGSYKTICNNRSTTRQSTTMGPIEGMVKAFTSPILDVLRPSRKENVIGSIRPSGNVQLTNGGTQPIYNPGDRTRTTIKEQTENGKQHLYVKGQLEGAYTVSEQQIIPQSRDTTNIYHIGNAFGNENAMSQTAAYNQRNNPNKTFENRPNQGGMSILNSNTNVNLRSDMDTINTRPLAGSAIINASPSVENYGDINTPQYYKEPMNDRMNPDILTAFKNNPYTHSLTSWA
jgi:hypothetical protein